jgi:hypothetical protein
VPAAIEVVELRLGDRVVDVDRREEQLAGLLHLVEPVHAGGRLLGDALDALADARPLLRVLAQGALQQREHDLELLGLGARGIRHGAGRLELGALVDEQRGVAAVVEDHVRAAVRPRQGLLGAPPVLLERLALPGEDRDAARLLGRALSPDHHGGRGVVLRREDVARRPADLGTQSSQRLDQHGRLDRHVQRARDASAGQRLRLAVLLAQRHQAGHLVLGELDLLAAPGREREVGDLEVGRRERVRGRHPVSMR